MLFSTLICVYVGLPLLSAAVRGRTHSASPGLVEQAIFHITLNEGRTKFKLRRKNLLCFFELKFSKILGQSEKGKHLFFFLFLFFLGLGTYYYL